MTRKIQEYELGEDFLEIRDSVKGILFSKESELNREKAATGTGSWQAQESFEELNAELESWNNKKDPEPGAARMCKTKSNKTEGTGNTLSAVL